MDDTEVTWYQVDRTLGLARDTSSEFPPSALISFLLVMCSVSLGRRWLAMCNRAMLGPQHDMQHRLTHLAAVMKLTDTERSVLREASASAPQYIPVSEVQVSQPKNVDVPIKESAVPEVSTELLSKCVSPPRNDPAEASLNTSSKSKLSKEKRKKKKKKHSHEDKGDPGAQGEEQVKERDAAKRSKKRKHREKSIEGLNEEGGDTVAKKRRKKEKRREETLESVPGDANLLDATKHSKKKKHRKKSVEGLNGDDIATKKHKNKKHKNKKGQEPR